MLDAEKIQKDFPIFKHNPRLVYLDSAAMSLKPYGVIDAVSKYYGEYSANVFRGVYGLSERATTEYELTRVKIARFIHAKNEREIVFVRNTTEAINLLAYSWGRTHIDREDEIVTTVLEHHSNFVPWQQLALENNAILKVLDIGKQGELDINDSSLETAITKKTKIFALVYVSNALGTIVPVKRIIQKVRAINPKVIVVVDAAQAIPHMSVDVQDLGCDFLAFSGQKMLGPTGAGVLWGKEELLDEMPPFLFGGEMIGNVQIQRTTYADLPHKFEAGTPHIAGVIGLGSAVDYLSRIGMERIRDHEQRLTSYALRAVQSVKGIRLYGPADVRKRSGVLLFTLDRIHAHDVAQILDGESICVRSGHHCTMPLHTRLGIQASVRATFYVYNNERDVSALVNGLEKARSVFK